MSDTSQIDKKVSEHDLTLEDSETMIFIENADKT